MNWISNLKLKYKLLLLLLFPVLSLLIFGGKFLSQNYKEYIALQQLDQKDEVIKSIDQLMDAVLLEELASIGSRKQESGKHLSETRKLTDQAVDYFTKAINDYREVLNDPETKSEIDGIVASLKQLPQVRFQIDNQSTSNTDIENFFNNITQNNLDVIGLIGLSSPSEISRLVGGYMALVGEIQGLRKEDYTVDRVILDKKFTPETYAGFIEGITSQQNYKNIFYRRAAPHYKQSYDNVMRQPAITELEGLQDTLNKDPFKEGIKLNVKNWDKMVDAKASGLHSLKQQVLNEIMDKGDALLQEAKNAFFFYTALLSLAFLASGILATIIVKNLTLPLNSAVTIADAISKGDLTTSPIVSGRKDEIGALEEAWSRMIVHLKKLTSHIQEEINHLNNSAKGIMQSIVDASSGTEETAVAVAETTTTVEELKQTADLSTAKAKDVVTTTLNVVKVLEDSEKSIHATIDGMTVLQDRMGKISESIQKLSEQSQEISEINNTVKDFAEQSNLLAINAGIEAAKAGEQGKGFAVVADEIRNLAEQSKQATKKVHTILKDVQNAISAVVMTTEQGVKAVDQGISQSVHTNESLRSLTNSIGEAEKSANQIEASSRQQLIGVQQVTIAMSNIKEASSNHVNLMQEIKKELEGLNSVGEKLEDLIHSFRLER